MACAVAEAVLDEEARLDGQSQMLGDRRIGEARVLHERHNGGKAALPGIAHIVGQHIAAELGERRERRLANSVTPRPDRGTVHDWASCLLGEIGKARERRGEGELHGADGTVAVLGDDDFGEALHGLQVVLPFEMR